MHSNFRPLQHTPQKCTSTFLLFRMHIFSTFTSVLLTLAHSWSSILYRSRFPFFLCPSLRNPIALYLTAATTASRIHFGGWTTISCDAHRSSRMRNRKCRALYPTGSAAPAAMYRNHNVSVLAVATASVSHHQHNNRCSVAVELAWKFRSSGVCVLLLKPPSLISSWYRRTKLRDPYVRWQSCGYIEKFAHLRWCEMPRSFSLFSMNKNKYI